MKTYTKNILALSIATALTVTTQGSVFAEETAADEVEVIEVIGGFRGSLIKARDLKRDALGSQDSIVAEDIADFPDLNLADALQRIPGVTITREGGEGRQISLRGMGPDFTSVYINGMQGLATSASAMDSRGSVSRNRAFDFNVFASELFNEVTVKKSYQASVDEGGIGGNVALRTAKPFDYDGFTAALSGQLGTNSQTDGTDPRFAGIIANTWDNFGALASVSYSERSINEQGYNGYRWRKRSSDDAISVSDSITGETREALDAGEVFFNRGNRYTVWENEQERLGLTTALQYRPTENLSIEFDALYSKLTNDRNEWHLPTAGSSSTALGSIDALEIIPASDGDGYEAVYGEFSNVNLRTESRQDLDTTTFQQYTLAADWNVTDKLSINALIGHSSSEFRLDKEKFYTETPSINGDTGVSMTTDYRGGNRFDPVNTYSIDPTDPNVWVFREIDIDERDIKTDYDTIKIDFAYDIGEEGTLKGGISHKTFTNHFQQTKVDNLDENDATQNIGVTSVNDLAFTFTGHDDIQWIGIDPAKGLEFYGIDTNLTEDDLVETSVSDIEEETMAAFVEYEWSSEIGDMILRGAVGARYYDTEITTEGLVENAQGTYDLVSLGSDYSGVLPTISLALDINDDWVLRGSVAKNLSRPSLTSLALGGTVSIGDGGVSGDDPTVNSGNPDLQPFESVNYDLSLEWYFAEAGAIAVGLFYKDIENFIVNEGSTVPYSETGFPLALLGDNQTGDSLFLYNRPVNGDDTSVQGLEVSFQVDLDFLPEPFNKLGISSNYTYADGEFFYENIQGGTTSQTKAFPGLSEHSGNFTLYYETDVWGARVSTVYRSDYITDGDGVGEDADEVGFHASTNVDFSAFYQVSENLKVTFEGINLTNVADEQYNDSADRIYNVTTSGRTFYVGASYKF
jgi:TonB-dependent receptor